MKQGQDMLVKVLFQQDLPPEACLNFQVILEQRNS